jgi:pyruvate dehydrogenase E1 component alpha subunit
MFEKIDPRKGKRLQLLKEDGTLTEVAENYPLMEDEQILEAYKTMILTREADEWAVSLNRQGRMPTYPPVRGQEANAIGSLMALRNDDWFVQAFREMGGLLVRGIPLNQQYLYFLGNEIGSKYKSGTYTLPISVPIASQTLHAVGLAYAEKYKKTDRIAITFVGDGGTSEGDFHEALNFAGVWHAPVIFYIQNNQWAISVPRAKQSASKTLAEKAFAYGFEGIQVDGNDILAVYAATTIAAEKARNGDGPTLIEGFTYRLGAHTTADDPKRYRADEEVESWEKKDPIIRIEKYLISKDLLKEDEIESMKKDAKKEAQKAFEDAEKYEKPSLDDTFRYTFKEMPRVLEVQLEKRRELEGGE